MKRLLFAKLLKANPWLTVHNNGAGGEGGTGGGTGGTGTEGAGGGEGGEGGSKGGTGGSGGTGNDENAPKFSQAQLNKILADDKRKHQEQVNKTIQQLEDVKKQKGLSDQARQQLEGQIEELKTSLLTKEEMAKKEIERKDQEYKTQLQSVTQERDVWRNQFAEEATRNQIVMAATENKAVRAEQIMELLMPKTRLVEAVDEHDKTKKRYVPKVKFRTKSEAGEELELDLTIQDAVKRMKDEPERFGNLFESGLSGGLGGNGSAGGGGSTNGSVPPDDPQQFRLWRNNRKKAGRT